MPARPAPQEADLAALFRRHGFALSDVPILQPAEPFIELSGEDIRRRLFLIAESTGEDLCLRPEFTIPAARAYLAAGAANRSDVAFIGPVFRQRGDGPGEFIQASLESFGRTDLAAADADMLALAFDTEEALGKTSGQVHIGDVGLVTALISAMGIPAAMARKLRKNGLAALARNDAAAQGNGLSDYQGVLAALKGADPAEARAFVKDLLSIAGIKAIGGRTPAEIAARFLEKSEDNGAGLAAEQAQLLARFEKIAGAPGKVARDIRTLAQEAGLDLDAALDLFEQRTELITARGIDLTRLEATIALARNLDYYTGFVFEFASTSSKRPRLAGGRYDNLLRRLGASRDIPAVGCAIWIERFGAGT